MKRLAVVALLFAACQRADEKGAVATSASATGSAAVKVDTAGVAPRIDQIQPPLDIKKPPDDAVKTSSGLIYKKIESLPAGDSPKRNDTVMIIYTGWRQGSGETFFSNRGRQPMPLQLANTAIGFTEAMQLLKKGEKAMLWLPPEIGYKGDPPAGQVRETLVYEVEIVDIEPAPPVPQDLSGPLGAHDKLPSGIRAVVVRPGTGKERPKSWDTVTFNYSAWDQDGRMFDSTEMRKRPATIAPYRQSPAMEEMLTSMLPGSRVRFWVPSERMEQPSGKPTATLPQGLLVYELDLVTIQKGNKPPPTPPDVAAPPASAKKTEKGVAYRVLKAGPNHRKGPRPSATDTVRVHYAGWTTDGRLFDSSLIKGEPAEFSLQGVIAGWTDGIPVMAVGDKVRFWIPDQLAYAGAPNKPQGMLVFDVELLEIKQQTAEADDPHGGHGHGAHGHGEPPQQPAPPDVAAPPADAKKSPLGVHYKILRAVPNAKKPTIDSTVKVHYTGWQTNGTQFDSSRTAGQPVEFALRRVIKGWQDAFPQIGVGEQARLWIPEALAYPGGGGPSGMLVFDVELLEIK